VLATTINKYCYLSCRFLPPFFNHRHRIVYSKVETTQEVSEIQHPAVRSVIEFMDIQKGLEIHHDGDLPARTGLGSSSSFTVGMLHSLYALKGIMPGKKRLAEEAIHIERNILNENVGSQDQVSAAFGGFNKIVFQHEDFYETPVIMNPDRFRELQSHMLLFFTGISRFASDIAKSKIENIPKKTKELTIMREMVDEALAIATGSDTLTKFGKLLHENWKLKRLLSDQVTNSVVDEAYEGAMRAGAIGGKLLGAGGGGFLLIFAKPEDHEAIRQQLESLLCVPFEFENQGSQIIVFQPDETPRYGLRG